MTVTMRELRTAVIVLALSGLMLPGNLPAQALFINDATLHTMGSQAVMQDADLLIRDGHVVSIGKMLIAPADATRIEANGRPVTPGFYAGITEMGLEDLSESISNVDHGLQLASLRPEFDVRTAYNPNSIVIPVTRIEGYTWAVLGASRSGSIVGGQGQAVSLDGAYRSFLGDTILFIDIGADASGQSYGSRAAQWMLLNQAMQEARSNDLHWSPDTLLTVTGRQAMAGFLGHGVVAFHVDRASDILQVLDFVEKEEMAPVIIGGAEAWMVAEYLAETGVPVILDPLLNLPESFDQLGARLDNAAILHEAGVTISFYSGEGFNATQNARKLRQSAGNAVANGLPYEAGLAALTINPARIFGLGDGVGTVQVNSKADLVIWSGDPLEVTSVADQVIIDGNVIPMVSRQTMLRERYLPQNPELPRAYVKP